MSTARESIEARHALAALREALAGLRGSPLDAHILGDLCQRSLELALRLEQHSDAREGGLPADDRLAWRGREHNAELLAIEDLRRIAFQLRIVAREVTDVTSVDQARDAAARMQALVERVELDPTWDEARWESLVA
ncbi:hypothetical protein L6R52_35095 [Myxococcota bacterium]|nr:hypothetical protein [Myxococcota bacterium]